MTEASPSLNALDAAYQRFPSFDQWLAQTTIDDVRWTRYLRVISDLTHRLDAGALQRAYEIVKRAAAIDTGAIEGLYEVDQGFTFTVAREAALWESELAKKGEHVRPLFEAQLHAYNYILDIATKKQTISEAAIRALHAEVCSAQATYRVDTDAVGPQDHALPKGEYKSSPNHVRTRKGTVHLYAPVDITPAEMARLMRELRSESFLSAHPIIQAAYTHYAFVVIHPFADGNGRVARALASVFTYRAISMPIVVLSEHKNAYLDSLELADQGNYQGFVDFLLDRSLETIKLVEDNLRFVLAPPAEESIATIQRLFTTRGGYTHEQVDAAGVNLVEALSKQLKQCSARLAIPPITVSVEFPGVSYRPSQASYREPLTGGRAVSIRMSTPPPASAAVEIVYRLEVPRDAAGSDDILLVNANQDTFTARVDELVPGISGMLQIRIERSAERIVREMLADLSQRAEKKLRA